MLMAVRHAILTSAKTKSNTSIYLQMDNKTAPSYVWKIREGGWGVVIGGGGGGYPQQIFTRHQQVNLAIPLSKSGSRLLPNIFPAP